MNRIVKMHRRLPAPVVAALGVLGLSISVETTSAQPIIITPPANLSVLPGETARFTVTASSATARTFQWLHNENLLVGATNSVLTISNVSLVDLGSYTVLVRNDTGETRSQPGWLKLARWNEILFFGHSAGMMQYCNGKTWFEYLADTLGIAPAKRRNYSQGNATVAMARSWILTYLKSHKPGTNTLVSFWKGFYEPGIAPPQIVSNQVALVLLLADAGATQFLMPISPNPQRYPALAPFFPDEKAIEIELLLGPALAELAESRRLVFYRPDMRAFEDAIWANPGAYGFTNLTDPAQSCATQCDASRYYFWDRGHPTTAANKLQAAEMYRSLVSPLAVSSICPTSDKSLRIQWQGGSGPFRMQRCRSLADDAWQSGEMTFQPSMTIVPEPQHEFFRILQLGQ